MIRNQSTNFKTMTRSVPTTTSLSSNTVLTELATVYGLPWWTLQNSLEPVDCALPASTIIVS